MARKKLKVGRDHVQKQAQATPLAAIEEMVWNGLDAGGKRVEVRLHENQLGAVNCVEIEDLGTGIAPQEVDRAFGTIGDSAKLVKRATPEGRALHGREGRGRFKALALCPAPEWRTTYKANGGHASYTIKIRRTDPEYFETTDPEPAKRKRTGTVVVLDGLDKGQLALLTDVTRTKLTERFAFYLAKYPDTTIVYDGRSLAVNELIERKETFTIADGTTECGPAKLTIIEWRFKPDGKRLHVCNEDGFSFHDIPAGVHAPGIEFAAYLCTPNAGVWADSGRFALGDLDGEVAQLVEVAKEHLRQYTRMRLAEAAQGVVEEWKKLEIYPYSDADPGDPLALAEREVFDIVAVQVNDQHPTFDHADIDNKKLTLRLIRHALETNPSSLTTILRDVVSLPKDEQDALAELLQRTPLSNLIRAASLVAERLDCVQAFEHILFDMDWKRRLLERTQLHRLLVHELWILGEEYTLGADDDGLRDVLKKHLQILNREELAPDVDVKLIDGTDGIPDLMLYRRSKVDRDRFEHLVIELKRPKNALGQEETAQIKKYAFTVAKDERFKTSKCAWEFVLLGNDLDEFVQQETSSPKLPEGCLFEGNGVRIWVRRWADVLNDARARYEFFRKQLRLEASRELGKCTTTIMFPTEGKVNPCR